MQQPYTSTPAPGKHSNILPPTELNAYTPSDIINNPNNHSYSFPRTPYQALPVNRNQVQGNAFVGNGPHIPQFPLQDILSNQGQLVLHPGIADSRINDISRQSTAVQQKGGSRPLSSVLTT